MPDETSIVPAAMLIGAIASLVPLARAVGDWHLKNKKPELSKAPVPNLDPSSELGAGIQERDDLIHKLAIFMSIMNLALGVLGAAILVQLTTNQAPLNTGYLTRIVSGCVLIYLGWIKEHPWERNSPQSLAQKADASL